MNNLPPAPGCTEKVVRVQICTDDGYSFRERTEDFPSPKPAISYAREAQDDPDYLGATFTVGYEFNADPLL